MKFYNNLYSAYNYILETLKSDNPQFAAIICVSATQLLHFFVVAGLVRKFSNVSLVPDFISKFSFLLIIGLWLFIMVQYYSKKRREQILKKFNEKSKNEKIIWGVITTTTIFIPFLVFPSLFK